jgi:hypothetical protein
MIYIPRRMHMKMILPCTYFQPQGVGLVVEACGLREYHFIDLKFVTW